MALLALVGFILAGCTLYVLSTVGHRRRNVPSGPPTLPLIGNLHQLPQQKLFLQLDAWAKIYGPLYSIQMSTQTMTVITDRDLARQILDKRSAVSSDRMTSYVAQNMVTEGDHMLWMDNTPEWRLLRKIIQPHFTETKCETEHSIVHRAESVQMLRDMLHNPQHWRRHVSRFSNSAIMSIVYGIRNPNVDDVWARRFESLLRSWARVNALGATPPIDIFPFLAWLPQSWFNNWKDLVKEVHDELHNLYNSLCESVRERRKTEGSLDSIMDQLLDHEETNGLSEHQMSLLSGVTIKGGSDTTATVVASFIQAMAAWPEVLKKCHAEIDSIVGETRFPDLGDYASLPYLAAAIKEAHRWRGISGSGLPRRLSEDIWIDGKLLPKGSSVILNSWGLNHDPTRFANPERFDPDHFKDQTSMSAVYAKSEDRDHYDYGNGRRLCPGIHLAERGLFYIIARFLWAFDISVPVDKISGEKLVPDTSVETGYREGLTISAEPFDIVLKPRGQKRVELIESEFKRVKVDVFEKYEKFNVVNQKS